MAPKNRIWTINDLKGSGSSQSFTPPEESKSLQNPYAKASSTSKPNNQEKDINNPLAVDYCQPIDPKESVPLFHIPNLMSDKVCEDTLKRIHQEFLPIIRRRKFNVKSISELCCCGDGLDHRPKRGRKLRKMSNNVLGYNMTRWHGRSKTHTIHLRLRNPNNHNQLFAWEDVAGTMAHELSHCVHGPHNAAFYKLMEEILEEHATLLVNRMGFNPDYRSPTGGTSGTPSNVFQTTKGQPLGGKQLGNSRLLDANSASGDGGRRLGGSQVSNPKAMREAIARAAEARKRQMELTRRMMEKAKQPCVIEIYDSDEEEEEQEEAKIPPRTARRRGQNQQQVGVHKKPKFECIDLTALDSKPKAEETKTPAPIDECIDLTSDAEDSIEVMVPNASASIGTSDGWICSSCTLRNRPISLVCDACLQERNG